MSPLHSDTFIYSIGCDPTVFCKFPSSCNPSSPRGAGPPQHSARVRPRRAGLLRDLRGLRPPIRGRA